MSRAEAENPVPDPKNLLRRHWGYDSFRPSRERIVNSLLQERDVAVVTPTGGGKSLTLMSRRVVYFRRRFYLHGIQLCILNREVLPR